MGDNQREPVPAVPVGAVEVVLVLVTAQGYGGPDAGP
jgi:hypothetical protein